MSITSASTPLNSFVGVGLLGARRGAPDRHRRARARDGTPFAQPWIIRTCEALARFDAHCTDRRIVIHARRRCRAARPSASSSTAGRWRSARTIRSISPLALSPNAASTRWLRTATSRFCTLGRLPNCAQPRGHRLDFALHADRGGAHHGELLAGMLRDRIVDRRAIDHHAQRRDDSYRRKRAEIDRSRDGRFGGRRLRQTGTL